MALTEKLTAIADAIREKTGSTGLMNLDEMAEMIYAMEPEDDTVAYLLVDENGNELNAVLVEEGVNLTADATTDIRAGTTAVTANGIETGKKEIPAYYVTEGTKLITAGSAFSMKIPHGRYAYTKMQALFCVFNTSLSDSVSTEKVAINGYVYATNSTEPIAAIMINDDTESVDFGITNDSESMYLVRYFSYKEEY